MQGITKRFGHVVALDAVDFEVHAGEVVALVGDNGAGKSTLIKAISGSHRIDGGSIEIEGRPVRIGSPGDAAALGIETVYQDLALCDNLDVVANLYLGRESRRGRLPLLDHLEMEQRARTVISELAATVPALTRPVATLSGGQRQAVAVSRAVLWGSRLVLLDEPTAALGVEQTAMVYRLVGLLRDRGMGVVVISHNLPDVFTVADRIVVLRLGRNAGEFAPSTASPDQVVSAITGGNVVGGVRQQPLAPPEREPGQ